MDIREYTEKASTQEVDESLRPKAPELIETELVDFPDDWDSAIDLRQRKSAGVGATMPHEPGIGAETVICRIEGEVYSPLFKTVYTNFQENGELLEPEDLRFVPQGEPNGKSGIMTYKAWLDGETILTPLVHMRGIIDVNNIKINGLDSNGNIVEGESVDFEVINGHKIRINYKGRVQISVPITNYDSNVSLEYSQSELPENEIEDFPEGFAMEIIKGIREQLSGEALEKFQDMVDVDGLSLKDKLDIIADAKDIPDSVKVKAIASVMQKYCCYNGSTAIMTHNGKSWGSTWQRIINDDERIRLTCDTSTRMFILMCQRMGMKAGHIELDGILGKKGDYLIGGGIPHAKALVEIDGIWESIETTELMPEEEGIVSGNMAMRFKGELEGLSHTDRSMIVDERVKPEVTKDSEIRKNKPTYFLIGFIIVLIIATGLISSIPSLKRSKLNVLLRNSLKRIFGLLTRDTRQLVFPLFYGKILTEKYGLLRLQGISRKPFSKYRKERKTARLEEAMLILQEHEPLTVSEFQKIFNEKAESLKVSQEKISNSVARKILNELVKKSPEEVSKVKKNRRNYYLLRETPSQAARDVRGDDKLPVAKGQTPTTKGRVFRSLFRMLSVGIIIRLVLPAISRAASSPMAEGLKRVTDEASQGDIVGAVVKVVLLALPIVAVGLLYYVKNLHRQAHQKGHAFRKTQILGIILGLFLTILGGLGGNFAASEPASAAVSKTDVIDQEKLIDLVVQLSTRDEAELIAAARELLAIEDPETIKRLHQIWSKGLYEEKTQGFAQNFAIDYRLTRIVQELMPELFSRNDLPTYRYFSNEGDLKILLQNRKDNKPNGQSLGLLIRPWADQTGALGAIGEALNEARGSEPTYRMLMDHGYRVMPYVVATDLEMARASQDATKDERAPLIVIGGHGEQKKISFGVTGDEEFLLKVDEKYKKYILDFGDVAWMKKINLGATLAEGGVVILESCSTGQGRGEEENMANILAEEIFPHASLLAAPVAKAYIKNIEFDAQNRVIGVEYATKDTRVNISEERERIVPTYYAIRKNTAKIKKLNINGRVDGRLDTSATTAGQVTTGIGTFKSLLMMFGVGIIIGLVWPAISRAASSPVAEGLKQVVNEASRWDLLGVAGIGLGLIAGGIAAKYGVKAVKTWVKQRRAVLTEAKEDREITFGEAGEIKTELVEIVKKELPVAGRQVNERAGKIVENFLKGVIPPSGIEREALIKAVTTVPIATIGEVPVNFAEMVLGEVPGRENIPRLPFAERGPTLEELLRELRRDRPDYMREVVYFYQGVLILEGATLSESEKKFLRQSLVLRTLQLLHERAPEVGFNKAAETWARRVENLREKYGDVLLKQLTEKKEELARAVQEEIKTAGLGPDLDKVQRIIIKAIEKNRIEKLTPAQKEIVLRAVMKAKIWNHGSSIWEVLGQVFGVVPGEAMINEQDIKLSYISKVNYEWLEKMIAEEEGKKVFTKSRAMLRVETVAGKSQAEVILNGGYNTLSGMFYRALHELVYAMILNVQGRLPDEGQVNRELAGLINYYLTAGGILERLDKGVEYTLSQEMIRLIKEVQEQGLTEGIIPYLVRAMPALVDTASEISTYERIAKYAIPDEIMGFKGMRVVVCDIRMLFDVEVKFGRIDVKPRNREVFNVIGNIVTLAEKQGKGNKIKFAFVSNVRGLSKEVMEQMLIDYMLDYGLSPEVIRQIIDEHLILHRDALSRIGEQISAKDVYDKVVGALRKQAELVGGIEVTILTDNEDRWTRKEMKEVLWVILDKPREGEMLSTATGLVVAVEGKVSSWLEVFIRKNWSNEEAERLLRLLKKGKPFLVPARPVSRTYLERMEEEKKIYRIQA
ncbi:MAG: hypothetical protein ACETVO_02950 [bacterium]